MQCDEVVSTTRGVGHSKLHLSENRRQMRGTPLNARNSRAFLSFVGFRQCPSAVHTVWKHLKTTVLWVLYPALRISLCVESLIPGSFLAPALDFQNRRRPNSAAPLGPTLDPTPRSEVRGPTLLRKRCENMWKMLEKCGKCERCEQFSLLWRLWFYSGSLVTPSNAAPCAFAGCNKHQHSGEWLVIHARVMLLGATCQWNRLCEYDLADAWGHCIFYIYILVG